MKWNLKVVRYALLGAAAILLSLGLSFSTQKDTNAAAGTYKILAWNDLGMHCYNRDFADLAVLPPYNNLWVQVVQSGDPPKLVTTGITVTYSYADNTYSVGKTNFWTYAKALFGVTLADNVGLKGKGLAGSMDLSGDHYVAEGIPITEFSDSAPTVRQPYQLATVVVKDSTSGAVLATQNVVTPTSSEMRCDNCHSDTGRAAPEHKTGKVETNILQFHDEQSGTNLMNSRPVLCASCHGSNALGAPGKPGLKSLSNAMHETHSEVIPNTLDGCYNCHPGPQTRCLRDVMSQTKGMTCIDCHGTMSKVSQNANPWLNEPRCDTCHNNGKFNQSNALYKLSKDHGGLYCEACHDSTHAVAPSREGNDAIKFIALQGKNGPISSCTVCHTTPPAGNLGPHGTAFAVTDTTPPTVLSITRASANPTSAASVDFTVTFSEAVTGVDTTDFNITQSGLSGTSVSNVVGSGAVYTVTASTGTGNGSLRLDLVDDDSILDLAGNPLGGTGTGNGNFNTGEAYSVLKSASVNVNAAGALQGSYNIPRLSTQRKTYNALNDGPVQVTNTNSLNLLSSIQVTYGSVSYSEMLGLPATLLGKEYWFPVYDGTGSLNSQLRVGNLGSSSTNITVYIGNGTVLDSFALAGNAAVRKNYSTTNSGPLRVVSSANNIMTSMRYLYGTNSYSEELGMPVGSLTNDYWFPWYNNTAMASELRVANVGSSTASVKVYIGNGTLLNSFTLNAGQNSRTSYASTNNGPLHVVSTGANILPSIKVLYGGRSYSEMLGLPTTQLAKEYWMPFYDNTSLNSQVRVGNMGSTSTTITVYAGNNVLLDSYSLASGAATRKTYSGVANGPLHILSSATNIMVSNRELFTTPSFESYYELLAFPANALTSEYWFPWYNNAAFSSELRIAVP